MVVRVLAHLTDADHPVFSSATYGNLEK